MRYMFMWTVLLISILISLILQTLLWAHAVRTRNAGWVDFGWSAGMALAGLVLLLSGDFHLRRAVVSLMVTAWGARLAWHILSDRLLKHREEDGRYQNLRRHWGDHADRNFFFFFTGQAFLVGLFILPAAVVASRSGPFPDLWDLLGLLVAAVAVGGESLADHQLAAFRADPETRGTVCRRGLWNYSRHPNYFFEWVHWLAYVVMAAGADAWAFTWIGPVMMYVFLRYVTGIPHTERQSLRSRGEAYRRYQETTSPFFPWIPRKP
jgi:steroid 5-alpha reductase family enzyme